MNKSPNLSSEVKASRMLPYAVLALFPIAISGYAQTASISGTVVGDDGKPLRAAVTVNGVVPLRAAGRAESGADGTFSVTNLLPGAYNICVDVRGGGYLDPCAWEPVLAKVQLSGGQALSGYHASVKKGAALFVRVNDPTGLLNAISIPNGISAIAVPKLLVGIFTARGLFQPLVISSKDITGTTQQATVAQGVPSSLFVSGQGIQVTDSAGAAWNIGAQGKVQATGTTAPSVTLNITAAPTKP